MWDPKEPLHPAWESHRDRHKRPALQSLHSFGIPRTGIYDELGMESLQLIKTFTNEEKETCKTAKGWFWCCTKNSSHTIIVLLLQYCKLKRTSDESAQEWMGRLQTKVSDCDCNECDRRLTEQFIPGLDDDGMINEIQREVSTLEDIDDATSEWYNYGPKGLRLRLREHKRSIRQYERSQGH